MFGLSRARTLQRKLTLILLATIGLALLLAASALLLVDARKEYRNASQDLTTQADVIGLASEAALAFGDAKVGEQNLRVLQAQPQVIAAALYDSQGRLFAHFLSGDDGSAKVPAQAPGAGLHFGLTLATVVRPVISNHETIGSVYVQSRHGVASEVGEYIG
jgi:uncharacterized membrane protein affecting hemolysin expression